MDLNNLRVICSTLTSNKALERKRAAEELMSMLDQEDEVVKTLEKNSTAAKCRNLFTWTDVFAAEEIYFEKETEKIHQNPQSVPQSKAQVLNVIVKTVKKSTGEKPCLPWFRIFNFITKYLEQPVYADIFGYSLTSMMICFLNHPLYVTLVQASSWSELIQLLLNMYGKHNIPVTTILECLNTAVRHGSDHPSVLSLLSTEVIPFYQKSFESPEKVKPYLVLYLKGLTLLCKKNAVDFRGMLCKLGEFIIPKILHSNCFNQDELNIVMIEFLTVQLQLHAPCDVKSSSPGFHAADSTKWFEIVGYVYSFCIDSIEDIANKKNSTFNKDLLIPDNLLLLAVKCTNQITRIPDEEEHEEGERPGKRAMTYKPFHIILEEVSRMTPSLSQLIWISYISAVLSEFPELIESTSKYAMLASTGSSLLNSLFGSFDEVYTLYRSLFICEKYLITKGLIFKHNIGTWDEVWNNSLRHLTSLKNKTEMAELLRCLIVEVQPCNINMLLIAYVNRSLPVRRQTLMLLCEFLSRCALPLVVSDLSSDVDVRAFGANKTICPRIALTGWLMTKLNETDSALLPIVGSILASLVVKRTHVLLNAEYNNKECFGLTRPYIIQHEEFEKKLLRVTFTDPPVKVKIKTVENGPNKWGTFKIVNSAAINLNEYLQTDFETSIQLIAPNSVKNSDEFVRNLSLVQSRILLQLNLVNMLQKYGIGINPDDLQFFKKNMETLLRNSCLRFSIIVTDYFNKDGLKDTVQLTTCLCNMRKVFLSCHLCQQTKVFYSQLWPPEIEQLFKSTFRSSLNRFIERNRRSEPFFGDLNLQERGYHGSDSEDSERNSNDMEQLNQASMEALSCIIDYSLICDEKAAILIDVFTECLEEDFELGNQFIFDVSSELISRIAPILSLPSMTEIVPHVVTMVQQLCRGFHMHPRCTLRLWELCAAGPIANSSDENKRRLMTLIGGLSTFLIGSTPNGTHINIHLAAFKTFNELLKHDRDLSWTVYTMRNSDVTVWVLKDAYLHLNNPSHQARLSAADMICNIFLFAAPSSNLKLLTDSQLSVIPESTQPDDHLGLERKYLFEKLFPFIMETFFNIPVNLRPDERVEEGVNRTSIALFCLTRLIFAYPLIKKKSLICLFGMIHRKGIKVELACRALKQANPNATKTLCSHFSYIFNRWVGLSYALKDFPYQLFEYANQLDFYKNFKRDICVHLFEYNSMGSLKDFAKYINIHHVDLIKECYGIIMARLIPALLITGPKHSKPTGPTEIYGRLLTILGGKTVTDEMMKENLGEIALHLLSLCFNATVTSTWGCPSIKLPEPEVPYCSESELLECLEYLMQKSHPEVGETVISYLAHSSPKSVYNILVTFAVRIHEAHDIMEKFYRLHHFSFFVGLLTKVSPNVFHGMKEYVANFVTYAYLRLLQGEDTKNSYFVRSILFLLTEFLQFLVRQCVSEAKVFMYPIVSSLVSLSTKYPHHLPVIKNLLDILILSPKLSQCIVSLDPFPAHIPEFQEYRIIYVEQKYGERRDEWTLKRELQSILDEVSASGGHCTKERLDFIRDLLANRKRDFDKLLTEMEDRKIVENNSSEMIHRLIQMLVSVVLKSKDVSIVREACRCLGEIGPVDLGVLVLPQYSSKTKITSMINAISAIIEIVTGYLKADDIYLVVTSGKVLASILEVTECAQILDAEIKTTKTRLGDLLKPFMSVNSTSNSPREILESELETKLEMNEMEEFIDFQTWLKHLTCGLIECIRPEGTLPSRLLPLCTYKVEFCEDVLPFIVFVVLYAGKSNPMIKQILSNYFRNFISKFIQCNNMEGTRSVSPTISVGGTRKGVNIFVNKLALRSLLKCVHFLRLHTAPLMPNNTAKCRPSPWENNFCLDVDYMDLAKAAQYCGAYLTSILYVEISAMESEMRNSDEPNSNEEQFYSQNTSMYPRNRTDLAEIEILLLKAYTKIGEEDAVYGCGSAMFLDFQSNINHLEQRQQWSRVLGAQDSDCGGAGAVNDVALCRPLKELGLYNTLWTYLEGVQSRDKSNLEIPLSEIQYECGWRLSKWTINNDKASYIKDSPLLEKRSAGSRFHKFIYESIQAGLSHDHLKHLESMQKGLESIAIDLKQASLESSENIYGYLSRFQMFGVVEDFFSNENDQWIDKLMFKWKLQDKIGCSHFKYEEPFLYLRSALVHSLSLQSTTNHRLKLSNAYYEFMLDLLAKARDAFRFELAENCAVAVGTCEKTTRKELEVAKNHWARGEQDTATHMLRKLIRKSNQETTDLFASMLLLYGDWLSETMNERPITILKKFLLNACTILESDPGSPPREIAKANFVVAKYADSLYQNVTRYMRSDLFQEKLKQYDKAAEELQTINVGSNVGSTDQDTRRSALVLRKQSNIEQEEIQTTVAEKKKFLLLALRHYLRGLSTSNDNDLLIFRAVALWLENNIPEEAQMADDANKVFSEENLPTYKYIVVLHQLSARMGSGETAISKLLNELLIKCAKEHPLHTLPVLLTQSLLHKDQEVTKSGKQVEDRVTAAAKIVEILKKDRSLSTLMIKMEKLWIALIHLANQQDQKNTEGLRKQMSPKTSLLGLKALDCVAVPTVFVAVSPSAQYKDSFIGIQGFESFYNLVGGINSPKRICCTGTNGAKYNMLLKGQDDLRQDAVMQQVFGVMNKLLIADNKTKSKRLTVRTYKVVPLSQRSGIIEWCENTQTFGDYLVGSDHDPGAHALYRPNDYKPIDCRRKMNEVKDSREHVKKLKVYLDIAEKFKPVFRHFFFEKFKDAGTFIERRLAYTRSVATSSMVGYILGLGDRHVLNILIDKTTAELIHIDLGVAFEQGRILPTPETIPFRLTRDIVDGMGVSGVEGVFRKSCELTLEVLRNNSEIILTILEVLLYDPLYIWTLTADRVQKVQPPESSTLQMNSKVSTEAKPGTSSTTDNAPPVIDMRNNSAARVLLRLKQKLVGIEEGFTSGSSLSVPGHVTLLIQRAMDPERLCRLFPGWQPYL